MKEISASAETARHTEKNCVILDRPNNISAGWGSILNCSQGSYADTKKRMRGG